ncbi:hypothetical protein PSPO01_15696 [Paraphaeosphaeria sporulosa]
MTCLILRQPRAYPGRGNEAGRRA